MRGVRRRLHTAGSGPFLRICALLFIKRFLKIQRLLCPGTVLRAEATTVTRADTVCPQRAYLDQINTQVNTCQSQTVVSGAGTFSQAFRTRTCWSSARGTSAQFSYKASAYPLKHNHYCLCETCPGLFLTPNLQDVLDCGGSGAQSCMSHRWS